MATSSPSGSAARLHPSWLQQLRTVFIQTTETPNPESMKFIPTGVPVYPSEDGNGFYVTKNDPAMEIRRSPLAKSIFEVEGVKAVYLGNDFVTVTKYAEHKWNLLNPELFEVIMNWAEGGKPALMDKPDITDTTILDDDDEVVAMIKELIEARIRPAVQEDGGDIRYVSFAEDTGVVTVRLAGSCVGCPSSAVTLKQGVENMLMHYVPEVKVVEALEEPPDDGQPRVEQDDDEEQEATNDVKVNHHSNSESQPPKQKSYEERLAQAGIPFSD
ncbi:hypothetical protein ACA910_012567 [Epithemia clementina (nom. ined.)]